MEFAWLGSLVALAANYLISRWKSPSPSLLERRMAAIFLWPLIIWLTGVYLIAGFDAAVPEDIHWYIAIIRFFKSVLAPFVSGLLLGSIIFHLSKRIIVSNRLETPAQPNTQEGSTAPATPWSDLATIGGIAFAVLIVTKDPSFSWIDRMTKATIGGVSVELEASSLKISEAKNESHYISSVSNTSPYKKPGEYVRDDIETIKDMDATILRDFNYLNLNPVAGQLDVRNTITQNRLTWIFARGVLDPTVVALNTAYGDGYSIQVRPDRYAKLLDAIRLLSDNKDVPQSVSFDIASKEIIQFWQQDITESPRRAAILKALNDEICNNKDAHPSEEHFAYKACNFEQFDTYEQIAQSTKDALAKQNYEIKIPDVSGTNGIDIDFFGYFVRNNLDLIRSELQSNTDYRLFPENHIYGKYLSALTYDIFDQKNIALTIIETYINTAFGSVSKNSNDLPKYSIYELQRALFLQQKLLQNNIETDAERFHYIESLERTTDINDIILSQPGWHDSFINLFPARQSVDDGPLDCGADIPNELRIYAVSAAASAGTFAYFSHTRPSMRSIFGSISRKKLDRFKDMKFRCTEFTDLSEDVVQDYYSGLLDTEAKVALAVTDDLQSDDHGKREHELCYAKHSAEKALDITTELTRKHNLASRSASEASQDASDDQKEHYLIIQFQAEDLLRSIKARISGEIPGIDC